MPASAVAAPASGKTAPHLRKKTLLLAGTDKGGTGKSRCMIELCSWLTGRHPELRWAGVDPDSANRTFKLHFPEKDKVHELNLDRASPDIIYDLLAQNDMVIVDGAGSRQSASFTPWMMSTEIGEMLEALDASLTFMVIVSQNRETLEGALQFTHAMRKEAHARFLFVRSTLAGFDSPGWDASTARRELLAESGRAVEIYAPRINPYLIAKWPHDLLAALHEASQSALWQLYDRQRLKHHARMWWIEWRKARRLILPASYAASHREYDGAPGLNSMDEEAAFLTRFLDTHAALASLLA